MRLATYNIQFGRGKDDRFDLERIAGELEGADVIALQEVERNAARSGNVDQAAELARLLGDYWWVYGAGVDLHAPAASHAASGFARQQFGNMLLSRQPILSSRNHLLPKYASLGPLSIQRSALEAVVDTAAGPVRFYSVHLTHVCAQTRLPQIEELLRIHRDAPFEGAALSGADVRQEYGQGVPDELPRLAILMGDFNAQPDSQEYERMAGPDSPYGGRVTHPEGFVDAWVSAGNSRVEGVTAKIHGVPVCLDYCFVSARLANRIKSVSVDEAAQGSDHEPVWVEIDL